MSDTPPPELVDTVAEAMFGLPFDPDIDHDDQVESWRATARDALAALAEWADGGLIDPSTWTVVEATERGVDYCTEHHGVRNEDEGACNFSEWEECEVCAGTGAAEDPEDGDTFDCAECGGSGGFMECVLAPLHTLSPREGER